MPPRPTPQTGGGWYFDFPTDPNSVHYVLAAVDPAASDSVEAKSLMPICLSYLYQNVDLHIAQKFDKQPAAAELQDELSAAKSNGTADATILVYWAEYKEKAAWRHHWIATAGE